MTEPLQNDTSNAQFRTLNSEPAYKRVANTIEAEIIEGRLEPGSLLPIESDLATQLGVHRSTIREGIRSLESSGLIRRVGGKRLMISVPDTRAVAWVNTRALGLRKVSFQDLWEVQIELEPFCAELAAKRVSEDISKALHESIDRIEANINDDRAVIEHDIEFHRLVASATMNNALMQSIEPIGVLLFPATLDLYQAVPQARHRLLHAHKEICQAIVTGDADTARSWMQKHIEDFKRGYQAGNLNMDTPIRLDAKTMKSE